MIDFIRLKASSICQRNRYSSSTADAEKLAARVVQMEKYWAASHDSRLTFSCRLLAFISRRRRTKRVASALRLMAINRPCTHPPPGWRTWVVHCCARPTLDGTEQAERVQAMR